MSEERKKILEMLADKKITVEDAERLLAAVPEMPASAAGPAAATGPKYLRVLVEPAPGNQDGDKVNIRIPLNLVRAGLKFASFIPPQVQEKINAGLKEKGVPFDLSRFNPQDVEALLVHLNDLTVEVEGKENVRIFCES